MRKITLTLVIGVLFISCTQTVKESEQAAQEQIQYEVADVEAAIKCEFLIWKKRINYYFEQKCKVDESLPRYSGQEKQNEAFKAKFGFMYAPILYNTSMREYANTIKFLSEEHENTMVGFGFRSDFNLLVKQSEIEFAIAEKEKDVMYVEDLIYKHIRVIPTDDPDKFLFYIYSELWVDSAGNFEFIGGRQCKHEVIYSIKDGFSDYTYKLLSLCDRFYLFEGFTI